MRNRPTSLARWHLDCRGGIALIFALVLPALLGIIGVVSDYAMMTMLRSQLQQAADAAAIAGAREIPLAMSSVKQVSSAVRAFAAFKLTDDSAASDDKLATENFSLDVEVVDDFSAVNVTISEAWTPFFLHFVKSGVTPVTVTSKARYVGRNNVCVLGLGSDKSSVYLDKNSRLTGKNCGVFSNSTDASGLKIDSGAVVAAQIICSGGGASISASASVTPAPITDCPPVEDPLAKRAAPAAGACDYNDVFLKDITKTINPGVYCGGLIVTGTSSVTLNPGIYVIRDGGFDVTGQASVTGDGVGFFLTGAAAKPVKFTAKTHISLAAPKDGPMSGLLIFEDRMITAKMKHKISSDDARVLLGTIYLPVGGLVVDAKEPVADQSAYTAIVAQTIELNMGPNLVLNADYDMSDVPVPSGIAGSSQVVLSN
jgi:Flp pilus assembly protein TadG